MKLLQSLTGNFKGALVRVVGRRFSTAAEEEYGRRNYARNIDEYNTVIRSITAQRRNFLLRDVYDDMTLDGVQPTRETFHSLFVGTMKGARLQDAFFFKDQMRVMGLIPDVTLYNLLISACGKGKKSDQAIRAFEEMKRLGIKPIQQTYICLLNACAASGRVDIVRTIVQDMIAAGLALNEFCYAGLVAAYKNKVPLTDDFDKKVIEYVEKARGRSSVETSSSAVTDIMGVSEEDLYNIPTSDYVQRRGGFINKNLVVYHTAFTACADLKNVKLMEDLNKLLQKESRTPDTYIVMQTMRCYLNAGEIDRGVQTFEEYMNSRRVPAIELFVTLVEGAMNGYTARGMQIATETLEKMNSRNFFLNPRMGSDLLQIAAGEKEGQYTTANYIWDLMQARNIEPTFPAVKAYYEGLQRFNIPADDPRLATVSKVYDTLNLRFGPRRF